jgi:histidine triad (HIT) family protein
MAAFKPARIGMMIAGLEVPHLHIHVVPIRGMHDLDFGNQDPNPDPKVMDEAAEAIRAEIERLR